VLSCLDRVPWARERQMRGIVIDKLFPVPTVPSPGMAQALTPIGYERRPSSWSACNPTSS
jgi:hypothetical protein